MLARDRMPSDKEHVTHGVLCVRFVLAKSTCCLWLQIYFFPLQLRSNPPRRWTRIISPITTMYYMAYGDNGNTEILRFGTPLANCLPVVGGSRGERRCIRRGRFSWNSLDDYELTTFWQRGACCSKKTRRRQCDIRPLHERHHVAQRCLPVESACHGIRTSRIR